MKHLPIIITILITLTTAAVGYGKLVNSEKETKEKVVEIKTEVKENVEKIHEAEKVNVEQSIIQERVIKLLDKLENKIEELDKS